MAAPVFKTLPPGCRIIGEAATPPKPPVSSSVLHVPPVSAPLTRSEEAEGVKGPETTKEPEPVPQPRYYTSTTVTPEGLHSARLVGYSEDQLQEIYQFTQQRHGAKPYAT
jgi:hypothetical protein